jgi:hypothetical protein
VGLYSKIAGLNLAPSTLDKQAQGLSSTSLSLFLKADGSDLTSSVLDKKAHGPDGGSQGSDNRTQDLYNVARDKHDFCVVPDMIPVFCVIETVTSAGVSADKHG